jgi:hypothetical protein
MEKIRIRVDESEGQVEVDGFFVPDTEGLFAITCPADELCDLTHVGTGLAVLKGVSVRDATQAACQLYAAHPEVWRQTTPRAVATKLPRPLGPWLKLVRLAHEQDLPFTLLRSYEEYRRAASAAISDVVDRETTSDFPPAVPDAALDVSK